MNIRLVYNTVDNSTLRWYNCLLQQTAMNWSYKWIFNAVMMNICYIGLRNKLLIMNDVA